MEAIQSQFNHGRFESIFKSEEEDSSEQKQELLLHEEQSNHSSHHLKLINEQGFKKQEQLQDDSACHEVEDSLDEKGETLRLISSRQQPSDLNSIETIEGVMIAAISSAVAAAAEVEASDALNGFSSTTISVAEKKRAKQSYVQAVARHLLFADRNLSLCDKFFKFPNIDLFLNIECLMACENGESEIIGSNFSVVNRCKLITHSEMSSRTRALHIHLSDKQSLQPSWQMMVDRLNNSGIDSLQNVSTIIRNFCLSPAAAIQHVPKNMKAKQLQQALLEKAETMEVQTAIDDLFEQKPNKPIFIWRGVAKSLVSIHLNEPLIRLLNYTPEELQLEMIHSGIPEFLTSFNYTNWVSSLIGGVSSLYSNGGSSSSQQAKSKSKSIPIHKLQLVNKLRERFFVDFLQYEQHIGTSKLIIEEGLHEARYTNNEMPQLSSSNNCYNASKSNKKKNASKKHSSSNAQTNMQIDSNLCKRSISERDHSEYMSSCEVEFLNRYHIQAQEFTLNSKKVCKTRELITPNDFVVANNNSSKREHIAQQQEHEHTLNQLQSLLPDHLSCYQSPDDMTTVSTHCHYNMFGHPTNIQNNNATATQQCYKQHEYVSKQEHYDHS